jgi:transposase, IS5 family
MLVSLFSTVFMLKFMKHSKKVMRNKHGVEQDLFTVLISSAEFPKMYCRDEAPKILLGLQTIYNTPELHHNVFEILSKKVNKKIPKHVAIGRPGMGLWEILVLSVMRMGLNANYDRIHYLANNDKLMRSVMGIETHHFGDCKEYSFTCIKENIPLLDEETIMEINDVVVSYGHKLLKKKRKKSSL